MVLDNGKIWERHHLVFDRKFPIAYRVSHWQGLKSMAGNSK